MQWHLELDSTEFHHAVSMVYRRDLGDKKKVRLNGDADSWVPAPAVQTLCIASTLGMLAHTQES